MSQNMIHPNGRCRTPHGATIYRTSEDSRHRGSTRERGTGGGAAGRDGSARAFAEKEAWCVTSFMGRRLWCYPRFPSVRTEHRANEKSPTPQTGGPKITHTLCTCPAGGCSLGVARIGAWGSNPSRNSARLVLPAGQAKNSKQASPLSFQVKKRQPNELRAEKHRNFGSSSSSSRALWKSRSFLVRKQGETKTKNSRVSDQGGHGCR